MPSVKCSVVYVSPLLFYVWPPLVHLYTRVSATRTYITHVAHVLDVGARIERLKLIRVYDRRIKPPRRYTECREKIGNLRAVPCFTFHHHRTCAESISVFIPRERSRECLCPFEGRLLRVKMRLSTHAKCRVAYLRAKYLYN